MGDTDFYGLVGELESLQDAYDSRNGNYLRSSAHWKNGAYSKIL